MQQQKKYKQTQPLKTKAHERKRMYGWYEQVSNILWFYNFLLQKAYYKSSGLAVTINYEWNLKSMKIIL